ncbi:MAG: 3-isopropylmalate dehydratase [Bacteroidetes bacterium]|nr:3-isopropylmalate dehydratase [Bacteroidota bacterium]
MLATTTGLAYVLGDSIDTDQIIPARYLVYSMTVPEERAKYGQYALSAVPIEQAGLPEGGIPFVGEGEQTSRYAVIVAGENFGCGSSREHAPFALREAGIGAVVAASYARIFYRNAVDGGFVVPCESVENLTAAVRTGDEVTVDPDAGTITNHTTGQTHALRPLGDVAPILHAGGLFAYARQSGMIAAR